MKFILQLVFLISLSSCASLPQFFQTVDDIATDDAITIQIDRDAITPRTDVLINLRVLNKDTPADKK